MGDKKMNWNEKSKKWVSEWDNISDEQLDMYDKYQEELHAYGMSGHCSRPALPHEECQRRLTVKGLVKFEAKKAELQKLLGFNRPELTGYFTEE